MSANTSIQWTDRSWNPVRGCSVISPGCINCYAMKQAHRLSAPGKPYAGLTKMTKAGPQWTGVVRTVEDALLEPLSWRKPQRVFVNSMSDLFHEDVPDVFIDRVFSVMGLAGRHTFQVLTKRADRMHRYMTSRPASPTVPREVNIATERGLGVYHVPWPLPNVWIGVSVEDQKHADLRIPLLLQAPAAVRFLSCEPLLGPLEFSDVTRRSDAVEQFGRRALAGIDWVIVGGESGPGARPFDLVWARSIVQQCKAAGVACFVKQLGTKPRVDGPPGDARTWVLDLDDRKGGDITEWPADLRIREFPSGITSCSHD